MPAYFKSMQLECTIYVQDYSPVADPSRGTCIDESTCAHLLSLVMAYSPVADPSQRTCIDESTCAHLLSLVMAQ